MAQEPAPNEHRLPAIIGGIATLITFVAIITEAIAYVAARTYLVPFGIDPASIGITPLNAALRLTSTATDVLLNSTLALIPLLLIYSATQFARALSKDAIDIEYFEKWSRTVQAIPVPYHIDRLGVDLSEHLVARIRKNRRIERLALGIRSVTDSYRAIIYAFAGTFFVLTVIAFFVYTTSDALHAGVDLRDHPKQAASTSIGQDLQPTSVVVEWNDSTKVPLAIDPSKPNVAAWPAYLIGEANGQYCLYFFEQHDVAFIEVADVSLIKPLPSK